MAQHMKVNGKKVLLTAKVILLGLMENKNQEHGLMESYKSNVKRKLFT